MSFYIRVVRKRLGIKCTVTSLKYCRCGWPRGLRRGCAAAGLLGLRVRIQSALSSATERVCVLHNCIPYESIAVVLKCVVIV